MNGSPFPPLEESAFRIAELLADIAVSLREANGREPRESPQAKAMRLLMELGPDNVSAIAKAIGVNRRTLYRWPAFREALDRIKAAAAWSRRRPRVVKPSGELDDAA